MIIGGKDAPTLVDGEGFIQESEFTRLALMEARKIEKGILLHWMVERDGLSR
jgi:2,5-diamino-6-(ribosylamino)-4(3H)-pyrimidinone 5'-phosphate reductase